MGSRCNCLEFGRGANDLKPWKQQHNRWINWHYNYRSKYERQFRGNILVNVGFGVNMVTQQLIANTFEYRDGFLYWKGVTHPNKAYLRDTPAGSMHKTGYRHIRWMGKAHKSHRLIFMLHHGYLPKEVDHINGDRADNRIENLRAANRSENQCNRPALASNTSGYPGVSWHKKSEAWVVRVMKDGKTRFQMYLKDLELAGLVASEARSIYHGKFAKV